MVLWIFDAFADQSRMEDRRTPTQLQSRVGAVIAMMAGVVAITPLGLALIAKRDNSDSLLVVAAISWLLVVALYRGLVRAHEHWRRKVLRQEIAEARRARIEATSAYQDKLIDQQAILDRIISISDALLDEGIIDPQLAINNIRLIRSHARDADTQIDDAIIEGRVAIGAEEAVFETIDLRDEIEEIASPFARRGTSISTAGPANFGTTDPAMFRLIVRSLITGAIDRDAADIAVAVTRNDDSVVCTVSDDGTDCRRVGLDAVSALARSLTATMGATLDYNSALGRNQYSIVVPAAEAPQPEPHAAPLDVLGGLSRAEAQQEPATVRHPAFSREELVTFVRERERNRSESVAARREQHVPAP